MNDGFLPPAPARLRLRRAPGGGTGDGGGEDRALAALYARAAEAWPDGRELLLTAAEVARGAGGDPSLAHDALLLTLAVLLASQEGSTRVPVATADELARLLGPLAPGDAALAQLISRLRAVEKRTRTSGGRRDDAGEAKIGQRPRQAVLGRPGDFLPLILDGDYLYAERLLALETRLASLFAARLCAPAAPASEATARALDEVLRSAGAPSASRSPMQLSQEQALAVRAAACQPLTLVTGGPGTGKTTIVASVLRALVRAGVPLRSVALAAPTGKAAQRMGEALRAQLSGLPEPAAADLSLAAGCPAPRTLHRLLGLSPAHGRFLHDEKNPLAEEIVIVDEASMIDLLLMERLLSALRPEARLVLLGDADQLPSVDAGSVLRDLLPDPRPDDPRRRAAVRLTQSHRIDPRDPHGRAILALAAAVNEGHGDGDLLAGCPMRHRAEDLALAGVECAPAGPDDPLFAATLDRWFQSAVAPPWVRPLLARVYRWDASGPAPGEEEPLERLFGHAEATRVLALTRNAGTRCCTRALNAFFHERLARLLGQPASRPLFPGEIGVVQQNDAARELWNGDAGLVLRVRAPGGELRWRAVFRRGAGFRALPLEPLRPVLVLGFALTVHMAQGSEVAGALLVLPERDLPLFTRELLYTAITRCRSSLSILGPPALLASGAARRLVRHSGLAERILACIPRGDAKRSASG
jgi:exodeoxyribonuclease V alpha subunit